MFVIIGTVTADLIVFSPEPFKQLSGDGFRASNLVFTERPLTVLMGGNGGNSAYVSAKMGLPTALCGAVGQDPLGDTLVNWLAAQNVDLTGLHRSRSHATSTSTIVQSDAANQAVFHHLGSTIQANFSHMPTNLFAQAEVLLCSSFPIMPMMRRGGFMRALAMTRQNGGITAIDIGPAIGEPVQLAEVKPLFTHLDYLIGNVHELTTLTKTEDVETAASHLLEAGARRVVIKRGAAGASIRDQNSRLNANTPGFDVDATISVGAGDSFNIGFLYGVHQAWSPGRALEFGNAVAALVVSGMRGVLDAPSLEQVQFFLNQR
jgi:sugar/nucleoside kinase (ribokinase family)